MNDFASAAMLRLIGLGLARQGLPAPRPPPRAALVPLADKRDLALHLYQTHGALALLRLGEGVQDAPDEPALMALALARDAHDLVFRWQRLERFVHSQHRTRVEAQAEGALRLRHISLGATAPSAAEDLLIFGLLVALAARVGTHGLRARIAGERHWRFKEGRWAGKHFSGDVSAWEFAWDPQMVRSMPLAQPMPGGLGGWLRERIAADLGHAWTVAAVAAEVGMSARSLQRSLAAEGAGFGDLLGATRCSAAGRFLTTTRMSLAEIAYVCGFSDQAHFTREFRRHAAFTPARFRADFAAATFAPTPG